MRWHDLQACRAADDGAMTPRPRQKKMTFLSFYCGATGPTQLQRFSYSLHGPDSLVQMRSPFKDGRCNTQSSLHAGVGSTLH